jgi:hypothetical protein
VCVFNSEFESIITWRYLGWEFSFKGPVDSVDYLHGSSGNTLARRCPSISVQLQRGV